MSSLSLDSPSVRVPPPLAFAAGLVPGLSLSAWIPSQWLPVAVSRILGWAPIACGLALAVPSLLLFWRVGTAIRPDRPATTLATTGPYRFTRNPMYLALTLVYAGVAILWQSIWALALLPFVLLFIDRRAIRPEELYLERRFGAEYKQYRANVPRWL